MQSLETSVRRLEELFVPPTLVQVHAEGLFPFPILSAKFYSKNAQGVRVKCVVTLDDTEDTNAAESEYVKHEGVASWAFRFKAPLRSFGTTSAPATVRIELFGERFFLDTFLGSVTVPVAKFADGQENKFKLPVFAAAQSDVSALRDPEALIEFTLHTSLNIRSLLTEAEITEIFNNLIKVRPQLDRGLTTGEKFKVIIELQRQKEEHERKMNERNRPAHFVFLLRDDKMTSNDWKKIKYNMADVAWQSEFLELFSGLDYIFHHLAKLVLNFRSRVIARTPEDREKIASLLVCLQRIVTFIYSSSKIEISRDHVELLISTVPFSDFNDRLLVFEMAKMLLLGSHSKSTVTAIANTFFAREEIASVLTEELVRGEHLLFKIAFLELLTLTMKKCDDEETLDDLKSLFFKRGITFDSIQQIKADFPDDEILDLIAQYLELSELTPKHLSKDDQIWEHLGEIKRLKEELDKLKNSPAARFPGSFAYPLPPGLQDSIAKKRATLDEAEALAASAPSIVVDSVPAPQRPSLALKLPPIVEHSDAPPSDGSGGADSVSESASNPRLSSVISSMLETPSRRNSRKISKGRPIPPGEGIGAPPPPPPPGPPPPPKSGPPPPPPPPGGLVAPKGLPKPKVLTLRSLPLTLRLKNIAANDLEETVFSDLADKDKQQLDLNSLADLFTSSLEAPTRLRRSKSSGNLKHLANLEDDLMDGRRRQQVAILLKRANIIVTEVRTSLAKLALSASFTREALDLLLSLFSKKNEEEMNKFERYPGNVAKLGDAERFLYECYQMPRMVERLPLLGFRVNLKQIISETEKSSEEVTALMEKLKEAPFKLLLSYVVDIANILRAGTGKVQGFQLSSLPKLMELKSPHDNKTTLLHFLVSSVDEKAPQTLDFAVKLVDLANAAPNAMAKFQSFFPSMIERLFAIQGEIDEAQRRIAEIKYNKPSPTPKDLRDLEFEMTFLSHLEELKEEIESASKRLNEKVMDIEDDIVFFGDHNNDSPEDATTREIRSMWRRLSLVGNVSEANCLERAKRDEDRFTFFVQLQKFLQDLKKAVSFVKAKKEKDRQRKAYQDLISDDKQVPEDIISPRNPIDAKEAEKEKEILSIVTPKKSLVLPRGDIAAMAAEATESERAPEGTPKHSRRRPTKGSSASKPSGSTQSSSFAITSPAPLSSIASVSSPPPSTSHKRVHATSVTRAPPASINITSTPSSSNKRRNRSKSLTQADGEAQQSLAKDLLSDFIASGSNTPVGAATKNKSVSISHSRTPTKGLKTASAVLPTTKKAQTVESSTQTSSSTPSSAQKPAEVSHSRKRR